MAEWQTSVCAAGASFWISLDTTKLYLGACGKTPAERLRERGVRAIHEYDESMLLCAYPALAEVKAMPAAFTGWKWSEEVSVAWGLHVEAIAAWDQHVCRLVANSSILEAPPAGIPKTPFKYVYVFEDDVGFSGQLEALLLAYATDASDLLTASVHAVVDDWSWHAHMSAEYCRRVPPSARVCGPEHVQRFSRRFLNALHATSADGAVAWSEAAVPTLCQHLGFNIGMFREEHIGSVFTFDGKITTAEWAEILKSADPALHNRMFHALKF
jgi:hypothetical protein